MRCPEAHSTQSHTETSRAGRLDNSVSRWSTLRSRPRTGRNTEDMLDAAAPVLVLANGDCCELESTGCKLDATLEDIGEEVS